MNPLTDIYAKNMRFLSEMLEAKRAKGEDTSVEEIELKVQEVGLAMVKGGERLDMFAETREDQYSANRAAMHYRAAAELLQDVARRCDALGKDPHAEVLKEFGITDAK